MASLAEHWTDRHFRRASRSEILVFAAPYSYTRWRIRSKHSGLTDIELVPNWYRKGAYQLRRSFLDGAVCMLTAIRFYALIPAMVLLSSTIYCSLKWRCNWLPALNSVPAWRERGSLQ